MNKTVAEIAKVVNGTVIGSDDLLLTGISGIKEAREGDLTFLANTKYVSLARETAASTILVPRDTVVTEKTVIQVDDPSLAFSQVVSLMMGNQTRPKPGVHPTAVVADTATIGANAYIGPHVIVGDNVSIGNDAVIYGGCFVGCETTIGSDCCLYPNVTIRERITVGNRVIIHSGTVIGSDGFGFVSVQGVHKKIPQIGTVVIEDDVEIGANVTVDRARFDKTVIGCGTKIDNLVQIAHNVVIGENCIIVAQAGVAGSTRIGDGAILAAQAGVVGHLTIGAGAIVAAQSGVSKSIPPNTQVFGSPSKPVQLARRINASLQRLPHYVTVINELKERVAELEKKVKAET